MFVIVLIFIYNKLRTTFEIMLHPLVRIFSVELDLFHRFPPHATEKVDVVDSAAVIMIVTTKP